MTSWKIEPEAVRALLARVCEQRDRLARAVSDKEFEGIGDALQWCPEVTGYVPAALNALFKAQSNNFKTVVNNIGAGIVGVGNATIAYGQAQEDMATSFEVEMLKSAQSGDFKYFEEHGYKG